MQEGLEFEEEVFGGESEKVGPIVMRVCLFVFNV